VSHPCAPSTDRSRAPLTARWGSQQGWPSHTGGRGVVGDVNNAAVHYPSQSKFDRARNISMVSEAESLRRMPLEPRNHVPYRRQMAVPIAVGCSVEYHVRPTFARFANLHVPMNGRLIQPEIGTSKSSHGGFRGQETRTKPKSWVVLQPDETGSG
jgi:hypothetical protein